MPQPPGYPDIYVQEAPRAVNRGIAGVHSAVTAFVGHLRQGPAELPVKVYSYAEFEREFGGLDRHCPLSYAVYFFFINGGGCAVVVRVGADGSTAIRQDLIGAGPATGMNALLEAEEFNLLCIPETFDLTDADANAVANAAIALCESRHAFYLVDPPKTKALSDIVAWVDELAPSKNAAVYFPAVHVGDPLDNGVKLSIAPSGAVAGVYARTDGREGVWKSPAGTDANLRGVTGLALMISNAESATINSKRINVLRSFPIYGHVVWGARTLAGADSQGSEYKYVSVRRLALFITESIARGTQWTVFESNDNSTWARVRLEVGSFMQGLFRDGALQGNSPREAYFVHCDADTTTRLDIENGLMNIEVGFAPTKPAEFLIVRIQHRLDDITL